SLALPGSKDCNRGSATPSDARGLQAYHCRPPQVVARQPAGAAWGTDGIARCGVASARPGAPSRVARWGRNIPAVLGMRLSRLRLVLPRYSKVVENTLKNGSVLRTNHFQISADGISLTGTQIVLICIIPIGESNAARTAGHADEGIVLFQNQKIPINREP